MDAASCCPKCGTPRPEDGPACRRCGLRLDRWSGYAAEAPLAHPLLDDAWRELEAAWADPAAHERFLAVARALAALDGAAARYRRRAREQTDDERAPRALEQLAALAIQQHAEAPRAGVTGLRAAYWTILVFGLLLLGGVVAFLWKVAGLRRGLGAP